MESSRSETMPLVKEMPVFGFWRLKIELWPAMAGFSDLRSVGTATRRVWFYLLKASSISGLGDSLKRHPLRIYVFSPSQAFGRFQICSGIGILGVVVSVQKHEAVAMKGPSSAPEGVDWD